MQASFSHVVQALADQTSRELGAEDIWHAFERQYLTTEAKRFQLVDWSEQHSSPTGGGGPRSGGGAPAAERIFAGLLPIAGQPRSGSGRGTGPKSRLKTEE